MSQFETLIGLAGVYTRETCLLCLLQDIAEILTIRMSRMGHYRVLPCTTTNLHINYCKFIIYWNFAVNISRSTANVFFTSFFTVPD